MLKNFIEITEVPEESIPSEQYKRIVRRYSWVASFCYNKKVLECSCGSGQGSSMLNKISKKYIGADIDKKLISICKQNNPEIEFKIFDACKMPFEDNSFDIILIFEAIYYLDSFYDFVDEARRVLKKGGLIFIVTANKDLYDFTKSQYSVAYYGIKEISNILSKKKF